MGWHEWDLASSCPDGWSHHGLAVLGDGSLVAYHPGERRLLRFDRDGGLIADVPCDAIEAHDIAPTAAGDELWIADCAHKLCRDGAGTFADWKDRLRPPVTRRDQPEASSAVFLLPRHTANHIDIHHA